MSALRRRSLLGLPVEESPAIAGADTRAAPRGKPWRESGSAPCWSRIAAARDLPPGLRWEVRIDTRVFVVESTHDGTRVTDAEGRGCALRQTVEGDVEFDPASRWPRGRVLAHATGEPRDCDEFE